MGYGAKDGKARSRAVAPETSENMFIRMTGGGMGWMDEVRDLQFGWLMWIRRNS